jgi:ABC-type multidrug transport system ATPase subunit
MGYCPQTVILNEALTVNQHLDYFRAVYNISDLRRAVPMNLLKCWDIKSTVNNRLGP